MGASSSRPRWLVALDVFSVALFAGSAAVVIARIEVAPTLAWWPALLGAAALGVCAADLVTGAAHWCFDRFFDESTPAIGPAFVRPFREHHRDPAAITRHGFLEVSGNNAFALTPGLWICASHAGEFGLGLAASFGLVFGLSAITAAFLSNQLHRWAHAARAPRAVRWLQRHGVVLSPEKHALHHRGAHDRAYCVTTGWLNPLLDRIGLFAALERMLRPPGPRRARS